MLIGGFLFISYLNVAYAGETYPNIDTSGYTSTTILSETNTTIITSWCIKNTDFNVQSVYDLCMNDWSIYYASIGITFAISISIVLFKVILKFIMIGIAKFQRYTNHTELSKNIMKNLMITYISTTVLIIFLVIFP